MMEDRPDLGRNRFRREYRRARRLPPLAVALASVVVLVLSGLAFFWDSIAEWLREMGYGWAAILMGAFALYFWYGEEAREFLEWLRSTLKKLRLLALLAVLAGLAALWMGLGLAGMSVLNRCVTFALGLVAIDAIRRSNIIALVKRKWLYRQWRKTPDYQAFAREQERLYGRPIGRGLLTFLEGLPTFADPGCEGEGVITTSGFVFYIGGCYPLAPRLFVPLAAIEKIEKNPFQIAIHTIHIRTCDGHRLGFTNSPQDFGRGMAYLVRRLPKLHKSPTVTVDCSCGLQTSVPKADISQEHHCSTCGKSLHIPAAEKCVQLLDSESLASQG